MSQHFYAFGFFHTRIKSISSSRGQNLVIKEQSWRLSAVFLMQNLNETEMRTYDFQLS